MTSAPPPDRSERRRLILFGAFDRHNLGDLLLAHCAAARSGGEPPVFAGLAARDLREYGGHQVAALQQAIASFGGQPADFVHVGGELLTTTAWEAAVMLQPPAEARRAIALHERDGAARRAWAREVLRTVRELPYVVAATDLPPLWRTHFRAVGGVALASLAGAVRAEALRALREATSASVRDAVTQRELGHHGLAVPLAPDPVSQLAPSRLFPGFRPARSRDIAVQLAAEWGDDASLDALARGLRAAARRLGAGITLFRAGLAPWHDDLDTLARLAERLRDEVPTTIFDSPHVAELCRLLAGARAYVGTSLHGWIVANRCGVRGECLVHDRHAKAAAYLDTWHPAPRRWRTLGEALLS